jgi:hypothetical protein
MFLQNMVVFLKKLVFLGKNMLNLLWVMFPQEMVMAFPRVLVRHDKFKDQKMK